MTTGSGSSTKSSGKGDGSKKSSGETSGSASAGGTTGGAGAAAGGQGRSGARVPVGFAVVRGKLSPPEIGVPQGLRITLMIVNAERATARVALKTPGRTYRLSVGAKKRAKVTVAALPKGAYPLTLAGGKGATLRSGVKPGP